MSHAKNITIILLALLLPLHLLGQMEMVIFPDSLVGSGLAKKGGFLCNVTLLPLQPMKRVPFVYGVGDVCVVACKEGLGGSAMPSKTWTIMSCGRPVLASFGEGELKDILEKNNCGVFTKAGDVDAFVDVINRLKNNESKCNELGKNSREFVMNNLTKEVGTQKYIDVIKSVVK